MRLIIVAWSQSNHGAETVWGRRVRKMKLLSIGDRRRAVNMVS